MTMPASAKNAKLTGVRTKQRYTGAQSHHRTSRGRDQQRADDPDGPAKRPVDCSDREMVEVDKKVYH